MIVSRIVSVQIARQIEIEERRVISRVINDFSSLDWHPTEYALNEFQPLPSSERSKVALWYVHCLNICLYQNVLEALKSSKRSLTYKGIYVCTSICIIITSNPLM